MPEPGQAIDTLLRSASVLPLSCLVLTCATMALPFKVVGLCAAPFTPFCAGGEVAVPIRLSRREARRQSDECSAGKLDLDGINAMVDELEKQGVKFGEDFAVEQP